MSKSDIVGIIGAVAAIVAAMIPIVYEVRKNKNKLKNISLKSDFKNSTNNYSKNEMARLIEWQERDSTVPKYMKRIFDELVSMKFEFHQLEGVQGFIYLGTNLTEKEKEKIPLCDKFPDHRGQVWYYTKNLNKNDGEAKNVMYHIVNQKEILDRSKKIEMK